MTAKLRRALTLASVLAISCSAQQLEVALVSEPLLRARLEGGLVAQRQRQSAVTQLFRDAGCPAEEQPVDKKSGNVICRLPGLTSSTIVVGGHYDFADLGNGIVDDWSGSSMLASLYQAAKEGTHQHTYVFIAFAKEERGLVGSSHYVKSLTREQKADVRAFVNLECLGMASAKVWLSRANRELATRIAEVASSLGISLQGVNVDGVGDDDSHPFLSAHLPVITIHSVTQDNLSILHSRSDRLSAVKFDDYYATYKLIAFYLAYLDLKLTDNRHK